MSARDEQHTRMVRYFTSMGIRTVCFVLAFVFIYYLEWDVIGWICAVGALILPYIAVVMANATRGREIRPASPLTPTGRTRPQLAPGEQPGGPDGHPGHGRAPGGQPPGGRPAGGQPPPRGGSPNGHR